MKTSRLLLLILVLIGICCCTNEAPIIKVYFSPDGGAEEAVINELNNARESVLVLAYTFTNVDIAKALLECKKRGLKVVVVLDDSQETAQYTSATFLDNMKIEVLADHKHAIMHTKMMIIDGSTILTGSYNWTKAAEHKNAEVMWVIKRDPSVRLCTQDLEKHVAHSEPYKRADADKIDKGGWNKKSKHAKKGEKR